MTQDEQIRKIAQRKYTAMEAYLPYLLEMKNYIEEKMTVETEPGLKEDLISQYNLILSDIKTVARKMNKLLYIIENTNDAFDDPELSWVGKKAFQAYKSIEKKSICE